MREIIIIHAHPVSLSYFKNVFLEFYHHHMKEEEKPVRGLCDDKENDLNIHRQIVLSYYVKRSFPSVET